MIRLVLCDTGAAKADSVLKKINGIPKLVGILEDGKSKERLCDSAASYVALYSVYKALGLGTLPRLLRTDEGKPYLESSPHRISISHRSGISLIGISDGCDIGVDIERYTDKDITHLYERFAGDIRFKKLDSTNLEIYSAALDKDGSLLKMAKVSENDKNNLQISVIEAGSDGYTAWTSLESVLKCDGSGFGGVSMIKGLSEHISVMTLRVGINGSLYAIGLAKK